MVVLMKSATQITPKSIPITIYLSTLLGFGVTAGDPRPAGGAADVKYNGINEIRTQITPKSIPIMIYRYLSSL